MVGWKCGTHANRYLIQKQNDDDEDIVSVRHMGVNVYTNNDHKNQRCAILIFIAVEHARTNMEFIWTQS